jgi:urease accessory protein
MTIVQHVFSETTLPGRSRAFARDTVTLGWEDRVRAHGRRTTDGGVEFGTSLTRGIVLRAGDLFVLEEEQIVCAVVERPDPVFVVTPRSPIEWATFAYHIGNRHHPVMVTADALVCPDAPGVEQLLQQHKMPYERSMRPFAPLVKTTGHSH